MLAGCSVLVGTGHAAHALPLFNQELARVATAKASGKPNFVFVTPTVPTSQRLNALGRVVLIGGVNFPPTPDPTELMPNVYLASDGVHYTAGNETNNVDISHPYSFHGPLSYEANGQFGGVNVNVTGTSPGTFTAAASTGLGGGNLTATYYASPNPATGAPTGVGLDYSHQVGSWNGAPITADANVAPGFSGGSIGLSMPMSTN